LSAAGKRKRRCQFHVAACRDAEGEVVDVAIAVILSRIRKRTQEREEPGRGLGGRSKRANVYAVRCARALRPSNRGQVRQAGEWANRLRGKCGETDGGRVHRGRAVHIEITHRIREELHATAGGTARPASVDIDSRVKAVRVGKPRHGHDHCHYYGYFNSSQMRTSVRIAEQHYVAFVAPNSGRRLAKVSRLFAMPLRRVLAWAKVVCAILLTSWVMGVYFQVIPGSAGSLIDGALLCRPAHLPQPVCSDVTPTVLHFATFRRESQKEVIDRNPWRGRRDSNPRPLP
jgi:hypothetical protein